MKICLIKQRKVVTKECFQKYNLVEYISDSEYIGDSGNCCIYPNSECSAKDIIDNWDAIKLLLQEAKKHHEYVSLFINLYEDRFAHYEKLLEELEF